MTTVLFYGQNDSVPSLSSFHQEQKKKNCDGMREGRWKGKEKGKKEKGQKLDEND